MVEAMRFALRGPRSSSHAVGATMSSVPTTLYQSNGRVVMVTQRSITITNTICDRLMTDTFAGALLDANALVRQSCPTVAVTPMPSNSQTVPPLTASGDTGLCSNTKYDARHVTAATAEK